MGEAKPLAAAWCALALAAAAPAQDGPAVANPSPGVVLPHPCYENTLCLHFSGAAGGPPAWAFPRRLYITVDDSSGRQRQPTPYFPRWYTYVGTHRYPTGVQRIVEGAGDLRTAAWYSNGLTARGGNLPKYEYKYWSCISRYNTAFWDGTKAIFTERKPDLTPFGPGAVITGAAEVSHAGNHKSFCDFSPFMQQEFRDWLTWRGLYDPKTGRYPGRPGGEVFADDPSPARARGRNKPFNAVYGTEFTTWSLRYWDPEKFPDKLPFDADPMPKPGQTGHIPGGFDAPRTPGDGPFARAWQWPDQDAPGFLEWTVARCVDEVLELIRTECGVDRSRIVAHQWAVLGNSAHLWEAKQSRWQQGYRARPHWTAITPHARAGLSGTVGIRDLDMWHDMQRLATEWNQAEFYLHPKERAEHAREEFIDIVQQLLRYPVHQTNGIWDGVGNVDYGMTAAPGEDALYWLFDVYPDRPFYLEHTPDYVPPPVHGTHRPRGEFAWAPTIWPDREFLWKDWRGFKGFELGKHTDTGIVVVQPTHRLKLPIPETAKSTDQYAVRAVSVTGQAGAWTDIANVPPPNAVPPKWTPTAGLPPESPDDPRHAMKMHWKQLSVAERREHARRVGRTGRKHGSLSGVRVLERRDYPLLVRSAALTTAHSLGGGGLADPLAKILGDATEHVLLRRDAAGTLGRIGATQHTGLLAKVLANPKEDPLARVYAARALTTLAPEHQGLTPGLVALLQWGFAEKSTTEAERVINVACEQIARLGAGAKGAAPALITALETDTNQWKVARRSQAAMALGALARAGEKRAAAALLTLAKRPAAQWTDPFLRGRVVGQAATLKRGAGLSLKLAKSRTEHAVTRWEAARGLHRHGRPSGAALKWFATVLRDPAAANGLRFEAARALGRHGEAAAVPLLKTVLCDDAAWPELRELCARALGDLGERGVARKAAGHALLEVFETQADRAIRWWAGDALNRVCGLGAPLGAGAQFDEALARFVARLQ